MKIRVKSLFVLLIVIFALANTAFTSFAAGTVIYDGNADKFVFEPGSDYSPTDLFTDFKGLMPGDSITQNVIIRNEASNNVKIRLYIRSSGADENSKDFLSKLKLRVTQDGNSNLFDAPASESAQLTEWVCLGTFYSGAEIDLKVTVDVPAELGNEYQDAVGHLKWHFKAEEFPVESDDPKPPQTGDTAALPIYVTVAILSGLMLALLLLLLFRKKTAKN